MGTHVTRAGSQIGRDARADMTTVIDSIRSIVHSLRVSGRQAEQRLGITSAQLYVLQQLQDDSALSINQLAERTFTHQSSVSIVVSRLAEGGFVTRTAARGDARRLSISLTPTGRALLRRAPDAAQMRLIDGLRILSRAELKSLASSLTGLTSILGDQASNPAKSASPRPRIALRA